MSASVALASASLMRSSCWQRTTARKPLVPRSSTFIALNKTHTEQIRLTPSVMDHERSIAKQQGKYLRRHKEA